MRGHGESSVTGPFTFQQLTDDIDALRQHFAGGMGKVIILGGSFGGYLAQQYTIQYPQHVRQLILRGTAPSWHHEDGALQRLTERLSKAPLSSKEMLVNGVFDKFESDEHFRLVMFALGPLYSEPTYDPNASLGGNLKTKFRAGVHNDLYSPSQKYFDYRAGLKDLATPTLVIVGEKDWICPPDESRAIADAVANSKLVIVENANHGVHLEQNKQVLDCIRGFLGAS
ncbi:Proline iminopeptidase [Lachnellula occidentalis]|uniref:Proline iminopeptidase n=1 Tax=Lachnellula occidentalis TaxID=215460 RepID=A0A8H8UKD8_9HELO|nr:Proline iminopeptidase [Lachnellula occidentalis]